MQTEPVMVYSSVLEASNVPGLFAVVCTIEGVVRHEDGAHEVPPKGEMH